MLLLAAPRARGVLRACFLPRRGRRHARHARRGRRVLRARMGPWAVALGPSALQQTRGRAAAARPARIRTGPAARHARRASLERSVRRARLQPFPATAGPSRIPQTWALPVSAQLAHQVDFVLLGPQLPHLASPALLRPLPAASFVPPAPSPSTSRTQGRPRVRTAALASSARRGAASACPQAATPEATSTPA